MASAQSESKRTATKSNIKGGSPPVSSLLQTPPPPNHCPSLSMARKVVSPLSVCVSAALAFVAPVVLYTAGVFLQSVLFSNAARSLVFMTLSRLYVSVSSVYLSVSHSWLARALQVLAFYCSRSLSISRLASPSLSSVKDVLDVPLPGLRSLVLSFLSTPDFSILLPRLHLHDLVDKACQSSLDITTSLADLFLSSLSARNLLILFPMFDVLIVLYMVYSLTKVRGLSLDDTLFQTTSILNGYVCFLFVRFPVLATCFACRHFVKLLLLAGAVIGWTFFLQDHVPRSQCRALLSSRALSTVFKASYCRYMIPTRPNMDIISLWNLVTALLPALVFVVVVGYVVVVLYDITVAFLEKTDCAEPLANTSVHPWLLAGYQLHPEFAAKYELGKALGHGAFGLVIQASRRSDGRQFAVKFLDMKFKHRWPSHPEYGNTPLEVLVGMDICHDNIIKLVEHFKDDTYFYVVQELFGDPWQHLDPLTKQPIPGSPSGHSLRDYLAHHRTMPLDVAHKVFTQLVSALTYLHSKGVAHCDIKPDNILIDRDANIRLIDLGNVIRFLRCSANPTNPVEVPSKYYNGTVVYVPPELLVGPMEMCQPYLGDVWALGAMLYEMVTGVWGPFATMEMVPAGVEGLQQFNRFCRGEAVVQVLPIIQMCMEVDTSKRITMNELAMFLGVSS